jgi:hypothetical protein
MYVTAREARLYKCVPQGEDKFCVAFHCLAGWRWKEEVKSDDIKDSPAAEKCFGYCGYGAKPVSGAKQPPR